MRRVRSISRTALVYIVLGFATTWAVAWALALLPPGRSISQGRMYGTEAFFFFGDYSSGIGSARKLHRIGPADITAEGWEEFSSTSYIPSTDHRFGWRAIARLAALYRADDWGAQSTAQAHQRYHGDVIDDARGLPFLALWCMWASPSMQTETGAWVWNDAPREDIRGGILLPDHTTPGLHASEPFRALPYRPIWSGLAINTAFYALLFFAIVRGSRRIKHAGRYRRGVCPRCRYDRCFDYTVPCPECGDAPPTAKRTEPDGTIERPDAVSA